jgi:transposase InsO family protein
MRICAALVAAGITPSMSRKADCLNNAPMGSFFCTVKTKLFHHRRYRTHAEAQRVVFAFIAGCYNQPALLRKRWLVEQTIGRRAKYTATPAGLVLNRPGFAGGHLV